VDFEGWDFKVLEAFNDDVVYGSTYACREDDGW
jgi:hypothetical protein